MRFFATLTAIIAIGCNGQTGDISMTKREGKNHFDRIAAYNDQVSDWRTSSYEQRIKDLREHPPGYRRAMCIYFSDADIDNGGFDQYFHNGFGCMTMSAIEGYERLGATQMVEIIKSALWVCLHSYPDIVRDTDFSDVPQGYFDNYTPIAKSFDELDRLYYEESDKLPGAGDVDSCYPMGTIDYYYDHFPEDFR